MTQEKMIAWIGTFIEQAKAEWRINPDMWLPERFGENMAAIRDLIALHSQDDDSLTIAYMTGFEKGKDAVKHSQKADNAELARELFDSLCDLGNCDYDPTSELINEIKCYLDRKDAAHAAKLSQMQEVVQKLLKYVKHSTQEQLCVYSTHSELQCNCGLAEALSKAAELGITPQVQG